MSDVEDYTTGRVLEKVLEKEKLLEKLEKGDAEDVRKELKKREEGAEEKHFIPDMKTLKELIQNAETVAVGPRFCLEIHRDCDAPQKSVYLDELGDALIEEGKAEESSEERAIEVLEKGKKEGHTHILSKVSGEPVEICNSCKDCCILWKMERAGIHCISKDGFDL